MATPKRDLVRCGVEGLDIASHRSTEYLTTRVSERPEANNENCLSYTRTQESTSPKEGGGMVARNRIPGLSNQRRMDVSWDFLIGFGADLPNDTFAGL